MPTPLEVWKTAIACLLRRDIDAYADLFGDTGIMELPFVPPTMPSRFVGRDAIRRELGPLWARVAASGRRVEAPDRVVPHETTDPNVVVVEFDMLGTGADGVSFRHSYVHVVHARDGRIVHLRDYVDTWSIGKRLESLLATEANGASASLARSYLDAWNGADVDLDAILSPRWLDHAHPEVRSIADVRRSIDERRKLGFRFTVARQMVDGDRVSLEVDVSGRPHVFVFRVEHGKLAEMWTYR